MLSIDLIRRETQKVRDGLARRGEDPSSLDQVLEMDARRRVLVTERDTRRAEHNERSHEFGRLMAAARADGGGDQTALDAMREETQALGARIEELEREASEVEGAQEALLLSLPNLPLPEVPDGLDESANIVVRSWGDLPSFEPGFTPLPHWDLGERMGAIDFQRGAKLSGSRFFVLKGAGATLERALINLMLDVHTREHGYTEVAPPALVREATLLASGNLPKFGDNLYRDVEDDLWLIPTAEVPLTSLHRDEILAPGAMPISYVAYTPCFRREKAAAGRDTRGIKRVHQFDKVEMYKFVEPEASEAELERLLADAEDICRRLELPYRVLSLCAGDIGFQSAKSFDIEVWAAGCEEWLEVSSCSTCVDFQARRANIRYRPAAGERPRYVHTLNGSGLALPRILIAILENNQRPDGSVTIPEPLRPYVGADVIR